jgi:hypothetical protein
LNPVPVYFVECFKVEIAKLHIDISVRMVWKVGDPQHLDYVLVTAMAQLSDCSHLVIHEWSSEPLQMQ